MKHLPLFWALNLLSTFHLLDGINFSIQRVQPLVFVWAAQHASHIFFIFITYLCEVMDREHCLFHSHSLGVASSRFGRFWLWIRWCHGLCLWDIIPLVSELQWPTSLTSSLNNPVSRPVSVILTDGVIVSGSTFLINICSILTRDARMYSGKSFSLKVPCFVRIAFVFDVHKRGIVPPLCLAEQPALIRRLTLNGNWLYECEYRRNIYIFSSFHFAEGTWQISYMGHAS